MMKKGLLILAMIVMMLSSMNVFADGKSKTNKSRKANITQRQNSNSRWDDTDIVHVVRKNKANNLTVNTGSGNDTIKKRQ